MWHLNQDYSLPPFFPTQLRKASTQTSTARDREHISFLAPRWRTIFLRDVWHQYFSSCLKYMLLRLCSGKCSWEEPRGFLLLPSTQSWTTSSAWMWNHHCPNTKCGSMLGEANQEDLKLLPPTPSSIQVLISGCYFKKSLPLSPFLPTQCNKKFYLEGEADLKTYSF